MYVTSSNLKTHLFMHESLQIKIGYRNPFVCILLPPCHIEILLTMLNKVSYHIVT